MCHSPLGCNNDCGLQDPYLIIELDAEQTFDYVQIYNRNDQCTNRLYPFDLYVSNDSNAEGTLCAAEEDEDGAPAFECHVGTDPGPGPFMVRCEATGRYMRLKLPGGNRVINLMEIYVLSQPPPPSLPQPPQRPIPPLQIYKKLIGLSM